MNKIKIFQTQFNLVFKNSIIYKIAPVTDCECFNDQTVLTTITQIKKYIRVH